MKVLVQIICILCILLFKSSSSVVNGLVGGDKNKVIEIFKPVQLIYPDVNHNQLIINETSIALLNSVLDEQLSVLGVVGSFHSGKSFLLNQLLGTTDSFKIGHYVTPQTMGIWMWGCKINFQGTSHNLLLLDTEGFYSSNVSETYDAKIFAITTLLSSHLIYNSVKIIDQSALEYLELLSRRTQLFALKSKIKSTSDSDGGSGSNSVTEEGLKDILKFPSLTWVVQDFFQDIGDQTPTEWLHTLLKAHSRDGELDSENGNLNSILSIGDIFPSIECHTLFLPSGDRNTLRNLDKAKLVDLNPIYIKELNQLTNSLFGGDGSGSHGKDNTVQLKKKLTGPSISTLLRLLVQVANGNSFPTVPSIWNGFIKQQQLSALEDSIQLYRDKMMTIHSNTIPLTNEQFQQLEQYSNSYSTNLYKQLLFGLQEAYKPGLSKLHRSLSELYQHFEKENTILIRNYCQSIYSDLIEYHFTPKLESIKIPTSSNELNSILNEIGKSTIKQYNSKTNQFDNNSIGSDNNISQFKFFLNSLERDIERLINGKLLLNKNEMELLLNKSIQLIQEIYKSTMNQIELPITISQLNQEHGKLSNQLHEKFIKITELAKHENYYPAYQAMNEKNLNQLHQVYIDKNEEKILEKARAESDSSILDFKKSIATVVLPIEEEQLVKFINEYRIRSISTYKNRCEKFRNSNSYSTQLSRLESFLEKQIQLKLSENVTQMKWIVMESLDTVRSMMISRVPAFWFQHAYENEAYREAEKRIMDKIKSKPLRDKVIQQFIDTDLKQQRDSLFKLSTILISFIVIIFICIVCSITISNKK